MSGTAGAGGVHLVQRFEVAAALCEGLRVLDLSDAPEAARRPLGSSARELVVAAEGKSLPDGPFDAVVALDGAAADRREHILGEIERLGGGSTRVLVALERRSVARAANPRVDGTPEDAARALAERLPGTVVLRQFLAEGSVISSPAGDGGREPGLRLLDGEARDEDAAALLVASGFDADAVGRATAGLRVAAAPVLLSYVRGLEAAHAELLRANRELMRERVGREGSAAASLLNAQRQLDEMHAIARGHEEQVWRVKAWYDAPRYHLVDRVRGFMTRIPGLTGLIRLLWSLISTRAESPQLDAAANPEDKGEVEEAAEVTRAREGLTRDEDKKEPAEAFSRLEQ